jgi:hypothetical protein
MVVDIAPGGPGVVAGRRCDAEHSGRYAAMRRSRN